MLLASILTAPGAKMGNESSLAEGADGIKTVLAVHAQTTMAHGGEA